MLALRGFATALFIGAVFSPNAHAAIRGTRSMRCRAVINQVLRTGRYYVETADGLIPVWDLFPLAKFQYCPQRQRLFYVRVPTLDEPQCHIGYSCIAN